MLFWIQGRGGCEDHIRVVTKHVMAWKDHFLENSLQLPASKLSFPFCQGSEATLGFMLTTSFV